MNSKLRFKIILKAIKANSDKKQSDSPSIPNMLQKMFENEKDLQETIDNLTKAQDLVIEWNNRAKKDRKNNDLLHAFVRVDNCSFAVRDTFEFQEVIVIEAWVDENTQSQFHSLGEVQEGEHGSLSTDKAFFKWLTKECENVFHVSLV